MTKAKKCYLHVGIALTVGILLKLFLKAENGLTEIGVNVVSIFIPVLYLWLTQGTDWTCWLCLGLIFVTGVMTPSAVFAGSLGNSVIITVISMTAFSEVLKQTGVMDFVVKWALTRPMLKGRPYLFIAMMMIVATVLSALASTVAVIFIFLPIIDSVCSEIGYKRGDPFHVAQVLAIFWTTNIFSGASPFGKALPLIMIGAAAENGITISIAQWAMVGIPVGLLLEVALIVYICFIWKPEASNFGKYDIEAHRSEIKPIGVAGKISLGVLLFVVLWWTIPVFFPGLFPESFLNLYNTWGSTFPLIFGLVLLCIIHIKGEPIADFKVVTKPSTVASLLFVGTVTVLGSAVSSSTTGINVWLGNLVGPLVSGMSPFVLVAVALFGCIFLTNFISNTVCMLLFYGIVVPVLTAMGAPTAGVIILLVIASCIASLVPSANVNAPFFFGPGYITVKSGLKQNIITIVMQWALLAFVAYPLANMILGF